MSFIRRGQEIRFEKQKEKYRILIMAALLGCCCVLTYYFHALIKVGTVFTHFFYIPIILASLWWRRKGLVVAIFLVTLLIFSHHTFPREYVDPANDYLRALMFIVIGSVVAILSERIVEEQTKTTHLNSVLRAIRKVNQLITREKDRSRLIQGACENLIATRGYYNAWIALLDESGRLVTSAEAGLGEEFMPVTERLKRGELTDCGQRALKQSGVIVTEDPPSACSDCPLANKYEGKGGVTTRLEYEGKVYGLLTASIPAGLVADKEEQALFKELAGDIAFALYSIELEERRREAAKLKQAIKELERSNIELEQFAYVASHDLQEPLRMVSSYVQLLARRYKGKLDADADDFIAYAVDGANRMQMLINDLLAYSRVSTRGGPFEPTECEAVLEQTLANLQVAITDSGAVVTHDTLPTIMADDFQLGQLFQNLIDNAIKFRSEKPPCVHISAERKGNEYVFSVRDNGIGIDPEYADRIFRIFQRLHNRGKYPGTGIGLAICKKIVERHGGRIWVDSQPGRGATFYFTMPIRESGIVNRIIGNERNEGKKL
jgi:signal transduction histidine kinase